MSVLDEPGKQKGAYLLSLSASKHIATLCVGIHGWLDLRLLPGEEPKHRDGRVRGNPKKRDSPLTQELAIQRQSLLSNEWLEIKTARVRGKIKERTELLLTAILSPSSKGQMIPMTPVLG